MPWGWWKVGDEVPTVAVAISPTGGGFAHVGIVYRSADDSDQLQHIHLAFHCWLAVDDLTELDPTKSGLQLLVPNLPRPVLEVVAARCRSIARNRPELTYGFALQCSAVFDADGHLFGDDGRGLNCATFVLAVFRSVGVHLVDESSWQTVRPDDTKR